MEPFKSEIRSSVVGVIFLSLRIVTLASLMSTQSHAFRFLGCSYNWADPRSWTVNLFFNIKLLQTLAVHSQHPFAFEKELCHAIVSLG